MQRKSKGPRVPMLVRVSEPEHAAVLERTKRLGVTINDYLAMLVRQDQATHAETVEPDQQVLDLSA